MLWSSSSKLISSDSLGRFAPGVFSVDLQFLSRTGTLLWAQQSGHKHTLSLKDCPHRPCCKPSSSSCSSCIIIPLSPKRTFVQTVWSHSSGKCVDTKALRLRSRGLRYRWLKGHFREPGGHSHVHELVCIPLLKPMLLACKSFPDSWAVWAGVWGDSPAVMLGSLQALYQSYDTVQHPWPLDPTAQGRGPCRTDWLCLSISTYSQGWSLPSAKLLFFLPFSFRLFPLRMKDKDLCAHTTLFLPPQRTLIWPFCNYSVVSPFLRVTWPHSRVPARPLSVELGLL